MRRSRPEQGRGRAPRRRPVEVRYKVTIWLGKGFDSRFRRRRVAFRLRDIPGQETRSICRQRESAARQYWPDGAGSRSAPNLLAGDRTECVGSTGAVRQGFDGQALWGSAGGGSSDINRHLTCMRACESPGSPLCRAQHLHPFWRVRLMIRLYAPIAVSAQWLPRPAPWPFFSR